MAEILCSGLIDGWVEKNIKELDPNLLKTVTKRAIKQHMVADANAGRRWVSDIKGVLCRSLCFVSIF